MEVRMDRLCAAVEGLQRDFVDLRRELRGEPPLPPAGQADITAAVAYGGGEAEGGGGLEGWGWAQRREVRGGGEGGVGKSGGLASEALIGRHEPANADVLRKTPSALSSSAIFTVDVQDTRSDAVAHGVSDALNLCLELALCGGSPTVVARRSCTNEISNVTQSRIQ
eukprot:3832136-Prymnesium_polylepis.1